MGELFALCGLMTIPVALVAAWILRRALAKSLLRLILQAPLPRGGRGARARACGDAAGRDRRQSRVVPRRPAARRVPARRSDLRRRHTDREEVVGEAVPRVRQRAAGRSDESALHPRDDPRGRSRLGLHHLSGRPHHDDRIVDEGVRRARGHCRAHQGRAAAGAHRRRGVHAVLAPGRQGPSAPGFRGFASASCRRAG